MAIKDLILLNIRLFISIFHNLLIEMRLEHLLLMVSIALIVFNISIVYASESSSIIVELNKDRYVQGENVIITVFNKGSDDITLSNPNPYQILKYDTWEVVYAPVSPQVITKLERGRSMMFIWSQIDNQGNQVPPGKYIVKFSYFGGEAYSDAFEVVPPSNSSNGHPDDNTVEPTQGTLGIYLLMVISGIVIISVALSLFMRRD